MPFSSADRSVVVLPVRRVLLPGQTASYAVGKRRSVELVEHLLAELRLAAPTVGSSLRLTEAARASSETLLALALIEGDAEEAGPPSVHHRCTAARLLEVRAVQQPGATTDKAPAANAVFLIVVRGTTRLQLIDVATRPDSFLRARATVVAPPEELPAERTSVYVLSLQQLAQELLVQFAAARAADARGAPAGAELGASAAAAAGIFATVKAAGLLVAPGGTRRPAAGTRSASRTSTRRPGSCWCTTTTFCTKGAQRRLAM